jgi:hypothetical protein
MILNGSSASEQRLHVWLTTRPNVFHYPCSQLHRMFNRIEEDIFCHGRGEPFGYPLERARVVTPDVSLGVAPTHLDNCHVLNVIRCSRSDNNLASLLKVS